MLGFLIALAAGAATPLLEGPVAHPLALALREKVELADGEMRAFAFMISMILAGVLCALFSAGSAFSLAVGGTLGYFGIRLIGWVQRATSGKRS